MPFAFSHQKTTQALAYLARRSGGTLNKMKALKLIFFADRYQFRRFGRPITGDTYFAMEYGPVPSGTKDLTENSVFLSEEERGYASGFIQPVDPFTFRSVVEPDLRWLAPSDVEALEWSWINFGNKDQYVLADYTHRYPEWKRWESSLKNQSRIPMDYRDFLSDPEDADPCYPLSPEKRIAMEEGLADVAAFESRW